MTKEEYLQLAGKRYDEFNALNKIDNFYDYEKSFEQIINSLGKEILEKNIGPLSKDRRKKKHLPNSGK
jgi:uncharacterized membrane protein